MCQNTFDVPRLVSFISTFLICLSFAHSYLVVRKQCRLLSHDTLAERPGAGVGWRKRLQRSFWQGEGSRCHLYPSAPPAASLPPRGISCLQPGGGERLRNLNVEEKNLAHLSVRNIVLCGTGNDKGGNECVNILSSLNWKRGLDSLFSCSFAG